MRIADSTERNQERSRPYGKEKKVVECDRKSDNECLYSFNPIDAGKDIEGIGGEGGQEDEVDVIQRTWIHQYMELIEKALHTEVDDL